MCKSLRLLNNQNRVDKAECHYEIRCANVVIVDDSDARFHFICGTFVSTFIILIVV